MQTGRYVRDLTNFKKDHDSADLVQPLKELAMIKDQSYSFFTLQINVYNDPPVPSPTNPIGTTTRVPVEAIRPRIMPLGDRTVYQIGVTDSFVFVNPPTAPAPGSATYFPLSFLVRLSNFGDRSEWDFSLFPGPNNTSQAIKTSMEFPQSFLELEYGKGQGAVPDVVPAAPHSEVYIKTDGRTLNPLKDYNVETDGNPAQYMISARIKFYIKTIIMI